MTCPTQVVNAPLLPSHPNRSLSSTNISSKEIPSTTPGITRGALASPTNRANPRNLPMRASTYPTQVPTATAAVAVKAAMVRDRRAASSKARSLKSSWYQRREKPVQVVIMAESLKDKTISTRIGTYKKAYPSPRARARRRESGLAIPTPSSHAQFAGLPILEQYQWHQQEHHHHAGDRSRHRPITIVEELGPHYAAYHQGVRPAQHFRDNELPYRGNEHKHGSRDDARHRQWQSHRQKSLPGLGTKVVGRLQQSGIQFHQIGIEGQDEERQIGVDQPDVNSQIRTINFQRLVNQADAHEQVVQQAVISQNAYPRIDTQQQRGPEGQDHPDKQQAARRRLRARNVIGQWIAYQDAAQRGDGCHLHTVEIGGHIQTVREQQRIAPQVQH